MEQRKWKAENIGPRQLKAFNAALRAFSEQAIAFANRIASKEVA